jgi:hypothetical protein
VSTDHGAFGGIEGALEERAKDGGFYLRPVVFGGAAKDVAIGGVELDGFGTVEEAAIEPGDDVGAEEFAFVAHGLEELRQLPVEQDAGLATGFYELAKDVVGDKADGVGEEAEDDANEEVRDLFFGERIGGCGAFEFELLGELEEVGGGVAGDALGDGLWTKHVAVAEDVAKDVLRE